MKEHREERFVPKPREEDAVPLLAQTWTAIRLFIRDSKQSARCKTILRARGMRQTKEKSDTFPNEDELRNVKYEVRKVKKTTSISVKRSASFRRVGVPAVPLSSTAPT